MKQPATDHISGSISKMEFIVKNGKPKIHRTKLKTKMASSSPEDVQQSVNDVVKKVKRDKINCKVRRTAHTALADTKKKISDEIKKDMENF